MECKYTKYTIIEMVPYELKSRKTPLYTILNSILLWGWLILYFIYKLINSILNKKYSFFKLFKRKYEHKEPAKESIKSLSKDITEEELLDIDILNSNKTENDHIDILNIETEEFRSKHSMKILKKILEKNELSIGNFDRNRIKEIGSFVLRKDIITVKDIEDKKNICNKILLVRSISEPVKMYMDFMLRKIF